MTTDAELYRRSSQYRKWSYTKHDLESNVLKSNRKIPPSPEALTAEEEQTLIRFVAAVQAKSICQVFNFPSSVRATAVSYFRKFYMTYSVMQFQPKLILCTCVFLASKSENCYVPIQQFCEPLEKIEAQQILDLEFLLFRTLDFTLTVHNALRPLHGFFLDMQKILEPQYSTAQLCAIHDEARQLITEAFISDACFLYTPTHIALAALMIVNEQATTQYMCEAMEGAASGVDRVLEIVNDIKPYFTVQLPSKEECKRISKKLNQYFKLSENENEAKRQRV